jgi:hypothetical protein
MRMIFYKMIFFTYKLTSFFKERSKIAISFYIGRIAMCDVRQAIGEAAAFWIYEEGAPHQVHVT